MNLLVWLGFLSAGVVAVLGDGNGVGWATENVYGNYNQMKYDVNHSVGGFWDFLITIFRFFWPTRVITNAVPEEKATYEADFRRLALPMIQRNLIDFLGHKWYAMVMIDDVHRARFHLRNGKILNMQNTQPGEPRFINREEMHTILQCYLPITVSGAVVRYHFDFVSKIGIPHDGELSVSLPLYNMEAVFNVAKEGRLWGITTSTCFVRLRHVMPTDRPAPEVPVENIQVDTVFNHGGFKSKVAKILSTAAPTVLANAINRVLRSKATTTDLWCTGGLF